MSELSEDMQAIHTRACHNVKRRSAKDCEAGKAGEQMNILAIDPGNKESAFVIMDSETYKPILFNKVDNNVLRDNLWDLQQKLQTSKTVIEMVACYGMAVGKEVFDTCVWIGRFYERTFYPELMVRKEVKMNLCHSNKAKDGNVIQALKDRFGDKGTIKNPGFFHGFKADCWQAFALGCTYIDKLKEMEKQ